MMTSPKRTRSPTKGDSIRKTLESQSSLEERVNMMAQNPSTTMEDINEYKRTELLRKSVADVRVRADAQAERRKSPIKTYSNVKSKIAGNMKSQKKAKKMGSLAEQQ